MNIWNVIYRFSWGVLAVLVLAGLVLVFTPKTRKLAYLQRVKQQIEERNAAKAAQIKDLQIRQERFISDPEFVERTAREAGMVTADEVVYKFVDESGHVQ